MTADTDSESETQPPWDPGSAVAVPLSHVQPVKLLADSCRLHSGSECHAMDVDSPDSPCQGLGAEVPEVGVRSLTDSDAPLWTQSTSTSLSQATYVGQTEAGGSD